MKPIVFIDAEINPENGKILDIGAVDSEQHQFHDARIGSFSNYVNDYSYIAGHNIIECDLKYLGPAISSNGDKTFIDTLFLSPLLFPAKPYHRLVKDDKLQTDSLSNPLNDATKSAELFYDEVNAFERTDDTLKRIWYRLLRYQKEFKGFFEYMDYSVECDAEFLIRSYFDGKICENASIAECVKAHPIELAYCLAVINVNDRQSVTPPWVHNKYPFVDNCMHLLRNKPCEEGCPYCKKKLDVRLGLKQIFGYDAFRTYDGEPLQEKAADAAMHGDSLLTIFPTGGGKSITFQLPALMSGENVKGLTVIISPLQSLMKDQVDNLEMRGLTDAVTINGMLSPIERAEAIRRVREGMASLLYISPESLRSRTLERLLLSRNIVRIVIDEAHCFSSWGQDFRVDYLYIGDFIKHLQEKKHINSHIPVSCFTATAKQKVIQDICDYFKDKLGIELKLFATNATRTNLHYKVLYQADDIEKYATLRRLIEEKNCPTIVYASRTKRTVNIAQRLVEDGYSAKAFHGQMEKTVKAENQDSFISGKTQIIVATSAFGMGVDKKDVGLVIHYEISDSLENYVQEAGRAGRDPSLNADCYVLFNENDLDKHFIMLNQTKLTLSEIQQVWRAIKKLTTTRAQVSRSPLEIAREAGWNEDNTNEVETRVKTAVAALEHAGYIERGFNVPHVYATSIIPKNMEEAAEKIRSSELFKENTETNAIRIIKLLISEKSKTTSSDEAESRVDYIADLLGLEKADVIDSVTLMKQGGILADSNDMTAYIKRSTSENRSMALFNNIIQLEDFLLKRLENEFQTINLKEINEEAEQAKIKGTNVKTINSILYYWTIRGYIQKTLSYSEKARDVSFKIEKDKIFDLFAKRRDIAKFVIGYLYEGAANLPVNAKEETLVQFSVPEIVKAYSEQITLFGSNYATCDEVEDALLYLSKMGVLTLEGGFLVLYNSMTIKRLEMDNRIQYKQEDYRQLNEFYKLKIQMIHIVGEYANMMVRDYDEALLFVNDYFQMDYKGFLSKYFKGNRAGEINKNITPGKYDELIGSLSNIQREIIDDEISKYIVVAAGPGSGKTKVLVHKLASLVMLEDVKCEQLLMLTFSRAAATEFKERLKGLIGNAAKFIEIKTFHSYCFDLLGRVGSLEQSDNIVPRAVEMIRAEEVEKIRITKTTVVIDEAQDMDVNEYNLICELMKFNEDIRVIAVGDDDQNIYSFRGSDSGYMKSFITEYGAKMYNLLDNYRSDSAIVSVANRFATTIKNRLKSDPIHAVRTDRGIVTLTSHSCSVMEYPVVEELLSNYSSEKSMAVLTTTNDEALRVVGLLRQKNIPSRLIQSIDGFPLYNLAELRFFLDITKEDNSTPVISNEKWRDSIEELKTVYNRSSCMELCLRLIKKFEEVNDKKYHSDLENYIAESQLADFCYSDEKEVIVSTIHKSKGHEFDSVYMILTNSTSLDNEKRRSIYVGLTRAKHELYVHYTGHGLDFLAGSNGLVGQIKEDNKQYPEPDFIDLQLTHRDVVLGFFEDKKDMILKLQSGDELFYEGKYLQAKVGFARKTVAILSKQAQDNLNNLMAKGYNVTSAKVRFIVAWKNQQNEGKESYIVLSEIYLKK